MDVENAQSLIRQYSKYQSARKADDYEILADYTTMNDVIFTTSDGERYSISTVEDLMEEFLNIDVDWSDVTFKNTDDGYSISYDSNGNTYTEDLKFDGDTIDITSTQNNNKNNVKHSKITNGVNGYNDLAKFFDVDNNGTIDYAKAISVNDESHKDPDKTITTATYKGVDLGGDGKFDEVQTYSNGQKKDKFNIGETRAINLHSHLGENINMINSQTQK